MDIPYTQQFSPEQTPLKKLFAVVRQNQGDRAKLRNAIGSAFYKHTKSPEKIAGNTVIALAAHGIIDPKANLTAFGKMLVDALAKDAPGILARNILKNLGGFQIVETLREMKAGGEKLGLIALTDELKLRGLDVSSNSSDLSGVCGWLREAGVLKNWDVDETAYCDAMGISSNTIAALKDFNPAQIAFLRAMLALNVSAFTPYISIIKHAELLYPGQISFNWKMLDKEILQPLEQSGLIAVQRAAKSTQGARGGKPAEVKPTEKFSKRVAEPILESLFKNAGYKDLRKMLAIPLAQLVADMKQNADINKKGMALEMLAIRVCLLLDLEFMGLRQTEENVSAGGEVDGMMQSARLIYSRWQIQCKATDKITYETLAKEFGMSAVTLASVIIIVSTGALTDGAHKYRDFVTHKTPLNMIIIDGAALEQIVKDPSAIGEILVTQARNAMRVKQQLIPLQTTALIAAPGDVAPAQEEAAEPEVPKKNKVQNESL
jgi:site-specific DNA-methyltransferase (cytosine-N4-specific)